jgi:hypothetical protein
MGARTGLLLLVAVALGGAALAHQPVRTDLLLVGVLCVERERAPDREGSALIRCEDGRRYHVHFQMPCSERLACRLGLGCVEEVELVDEGGEGGLAEPTPPR